MNTWEIFVSDLAELAGDGEMELTIRTLDDGHRKYTYKRVRAKLSPDLERLPDRLQVRFGRGQLSDKRFSIQILSEVERFPEKYRY
ncbi:phenylphosphate carboxylase subunit gamma [Magnetospirillum sp. 15-1]|uniref:phenylphosphate carboxylase subunit gamma n=1 Tax=Magnetospirillum sp. 15-1 TaxID=1979370 RepID=UPI000BBB7E81|nr:phenylphosphate carboxylase subunit gamma [Magnetospirillum sp. 15-1]